MSGDKTGKTDCGQLTTPGEGRKDDNGKRRLDLIPPEAIHALGDVLCNAAFLVTFEARGLGTDDRTSTFCAEKC